MNQIKTTILLTLMSLVVLFTAQTLGYNLIFSITFAAIFNFLIYFYSGKIALRLIKLRKQIRSEPKKVVKPNVLEVVI